MKTNRLDKKKQKTQVWGVLVIILVVLIIYIGYSICCDKNTNTKSEVNEQLTTEHKTQSKPTEEQEFAHIVNNAEEKKVMKSPQKEQERKLVKDDRIKKLSVNIRETKKEENAKNDDAISPENEFKIEMVLVPGGTFKMQRILHEYNNKERVWELKKFWNRKMSIDSFYIGKYEVTQEQWAIIMGTYPTSIKSDSMPVNNVSWNDIQIFIKKLNLRTKLHYRLPSEEEWEFAARGGMKSQGYMYSGSNCIDSVGWYSKNSNNHLHPIGKKKANELGIYDMSGNIDEVLRSGYWDTYSSALIDKPYERMTRGGSWLTSGRFCKIFSRVSIKPTQATRSTGFRLAMYRD